MDNLGLREKIIRIGGVFMDKKKTIIISSLICLLPILIGIILWGYLPDMLVRHIGFGTYSTSSKKIVVFLYPFIFLILHLIIVFKSEWLNTPRGRKRFWYMPILSSIFFLMSFILRKRAG